MKLIIALLSFAISTQAFLDVNNGKFCLACCGSPSQGCCNDCGLTDPILFQNPDLVVSKRRVVSTKSFIDDLNSGLTNLIPDFSGPDAACLDCCGQHPCCGDCGIDQSIFSHHYPDIPDIGSILGHHGSTPEPQSPENGNYGTGTDGLLGGLSPIYHGPIDPMDLQPVHAYYENTDQ